MDELQHIAIQWAFLSTAGDSVHRDSWDVFRNQLPLQRHISIQLISNLLQTLPKTLMAGVTQLNNTQLTSG